MFQIFISSFSNIYSDIYQLIPHTSVIPQSTTNGFNTAHGCSNVVHTETIITVIPIQKPGKDHSGPNSYRPISLTSCVCKTLERMINDRLIWYLEHNNILTDIQCGFRKRKSTADHLVRLESFIRDAFLNKQEVVSIFFDLEKAYDTTWKHGILKDLFEAGLRGRMPVFISKFLENRNFRARLGSTLSDQGSKGGSSRQYFICHTFSLKINSLAKF